MKLTPILKGSLLGLAVFLTACGSSDTLGEPLTRDYQTVDGVFTSLGSIHVNDTVTHLFEADDGTIFYAYSDRYDLDENLETRMEAYGLVTTYEDLDKALFEVKRLSDAGEEDATDDTVTTETYKNSALGISFSLPSNWTVSSEDAHRTVLTGPMVNKGEPSVLDEEALPQANSAEFIALSEPLAEGKTLSDYVDAQFSSLASLSGESTFVGTDRMEGVRYKTSNGDVYVFTVRSGTEVFELHFAVESEDADQTLSDTNTFSTMVSSFRFLPTGEDAVDETDTTDTPVDDQDSAPTVDQVTVSKWTTISSNAFQFSIDIPAAWYYVGGSTGYVFSLTAIEDVNASGEIKLSFNTSTTEGTTRSSGAVTMTRKVDSRYYTLTGLPEYETIMKSMLDSIQTTKTE